MSITPILAASFSKQILQEREAAAICIQKHVRGWIARKDFLPRKLFPAYRRACDQFLSTNKDIFPRAEGGSTDVYLPPEAPQIVMKHTKNPRVTLYRFRRMQAVRRKIRELGCKRILVAEAQRYKEFLIEKRFMINISTVHNIELYVSNLKAFDQAILELSRLAGKVRLGDVIAYGRTALSSVPERVRYDNLALSVREEDGEKIGEIILIDLEHSKLGGTGAEVLIRMFPYHADTIKRETQAAGITGIDFNENLCKLAERRGLKSIQDSYFNFADWLEEGGIFQDVRKHKLHLSQKREEELVRVVCDVLIDIEQAGAQMGRGTFPTYVDTEKFAEDIARLLVRLCLTNLMNCIEGHLAAFSKECPSKADVMAYRARMFGLQHFMCSIYKNSLYNSCGHVFEDLVEGEEAISQDIVLELFVVLMQELEKGREVYSFDVVNRHKEDSFILLSF